MSLGITDIIWAASWENLCFRENEAADQLRGIRADKMRGNRSVDHAYDFATEIVQR